MSSHGSTQLGSALAFCLWSCRKGNAGRSARRSPRVSVLSPAGEKAQGGGRTSLMGEKNGEETSQRDKEEQAGVESQQHHDQTFKKRSHRLAESNTHTTCYLCPKPFCPSCTCSLPPAGHFGCFTDPLVLPPRTSDTEGGGKTPLFLCFSQRWTRRESLHYTFRPINYQESR